MFRAGLIPIPCGGEDGKRPLVRFKDADLWASAQKIEDWVTDRNFQGAGVGILTGAGRVPLTVIDIDSTNEAVVRNFIDRCGPTPIHVSTPSGGLHLWYRSRGERSTNLRNHLYEVDVKGLGGFVVAPPSTRPSAGEGLALKYRFLCGSLSDLRDLPVLSPDMRDLLNIRVTPRPSVSKGGASSSATKPSRDLPIPEGERNTWCFREALILAKTAPDEGELLAALHQLNARRCVPPLPDGELAHISSQAWGYQERGQNWVRGAGVTQITTEEQDQLETTAGLALLIRLRSAHGSRAEPFAISVNAMAEQRVVWDLGVRGIRQGRDELLAKGFIKRLHRGGRGPRDPALYRLTSRR